MTSLIILLIAVAVVASIVSFLTRLSLIKAFALYFILAGVSLSLDNYVLTPCYNIVKVDWNISSNSDFHSSHRKTILSYVESEKWNEFPNLQKITEEAINGVLTDLRSATKASSQEAYNRLECYLNETFNNETFNPSHGWSAVRCFGPDNGTIRMWASLLVYGTSNLKTQEFKVSVKPSIIEAAIADVQRTLTRWEEEDRLLDVFNAKQDKLRGKCMAIWDRPMDENSQRYSLQWLHEHCNSKYPSAWTVEDIK